MLYLIGTGLGNEKDLTLKGFQAIDRCSDIYIEEYTSRVLGNFDAVKKTKKLKREDVEGDFLINEAKSKDVALLIGGDPLSATTHLQLLKDCKNAGIECQVIHNTSIMTAVAMAGLSLYKYGRTTTLCFPQPNWDPTSPYEIIKANQATGLHTLVLLDTKNGKEFMTCEQGYELLKKHGVVAGEKLVFCYALGTEKQQIEYSNTPTAAAVPACILVPGKIDEKEQEFLGMWEHG